MSLPIQIVQVPFLPPYCCQRCNATEGTRDYFIDTGIDIEIPSHADGRFFLCSVCMDDFVNADSNNFYTKREVDSIVAETQEVLAKAREIEAFWLRKVLAFQEIGIDLNLVWEKLDGRSASIDDLASDGESAEVAGTDERDDVSINSAESGANPFFNMEI